MATQKVKLALGTVYQNSEGGTFYFRYQVNGQRKSISLRTKNKKEAVAKARGMEPVLKASSIEVVAAHIKHARGLAAPEKRLELPAVWTTYHAHPERARPANVATYQQYELYCNEVTTWATEQGLTFLDEITDTVAMQYADQLRERDISVDTHNKRISRIAHVFRTLSAYTRPHTTNWSNRTLRRKRREEIGMTARRLPFTRGQEERILAVLSDPRGKLRNGGELRTLFTIGAFTGQRLKDCALLQWQNVHLAQRRISVVQFKTGKEVKIPMAPQLFEALTAADRWRTNEYVLPRVAARYLKKDRNGKNTGNSLVNYDIIRIIELSGLTPSVRVPGRTKAVTVYGFHSLRHSFVSFCIDHNIPKAVCVSILGADSDIIDQYYTHVGEAAQEQAIQLISGGKSTIKESYERALEYLDGIAEKGRELRELERILRG